MTYIVVDLGWLFTDPQKKEKTLEQYNGMVGVPVF
jgi:hypothetical protein